eukprot:m.294708 g.294708  ORF g.294708 m.294708 type:complete len:87 (+) comp20036_c0_seq17:3148-3408(+)
MLAQRWRQIVEQTIAFRMYRKRDTMNKYTTGREQLCGSVVAIDCEPSRMAVRLGTLLRSGGGNDACATGGGEEKPSPGTEALRGEI